MSDLDHKLQDFADELLEDGLDDLNNLILYNDDVNTFDFVIESLIEVCKHEKLQAMQCASITHTKGKCDIKKGHFVELEPFMKELSNRGLTVSIE